MNRRSFLSRFSLSAAALCLPSQSALTQHLILIVNGGGVRKKDYYEDPVLAPNIRRLAGEGFVFEEDHGERVASHDAAFAELLQGRKAAAGAARDYPTILDYIGNGRQVQSLGAIPRIMQHYRPRILVCREMAHDVGHSGYEQYRRAVKATDDAIGKIFDWVKSHPYFHQNTAIVIRPEFGRDDEVNEHGHLHHSYGFYYTHRVASIFWGPDFNQGIDSQTVIGSLDMAPTLAQVFNVNAAFGDGRVAPGLFKRPAEARRASALG